MKTMTKRVGHGALRMLRALGLGVAGLLATAAAISAMAAPIDDATAVRVARNYVTQHVALYGEWSGAVSPQINRAELVTFEGQPVAYVVSVKPSGYLFVSFDDDLVPVLLYSPVGTFDAAAVGQLGSVESWIIPETKARLQFNSERRVELMQTADEASLVQMRDASPAGRAWLFFNREPDAFKPLQAGLNEKVATLDGATLKVEKLGPLLSTTWNQGEDRAPFTYNYFAPAGSGCTHTVTGCVATATSQIMKYWNWPDNGTGSSSYTWNGQTLSATYTGTYNWTSMPNALSSSSSNAQIQAVAKLMQDVGVAYRMNFGCSAAGGSGAYTGDVATVLPQYFKYKNTIRTVSRSAVSASSFFTSLKSELDANPARPVLFSMRTSSGGHAVVVDGYQQGVTNTVRINMGWGGSYNAFYDISNDWSAGGLNWIASTQNAYVGIEPNSSVASCSYSLGTTFASLSASGGSGTSFLTAGSSCAWTVSNSNSWISVTPSAGSGNANLSYSVSANTSTSARSGSFSVGGQIFSVTQAAAAGTCSYSISSSAQSFTSGSGNASFSITTGSTCSWSIAGNSSWIGADTWLTFLTPTSGTGSGTISYSVSPNAGASSRTTSLLIAGQTHTVTQSGSCGYTIFPSSQSATSAASTGSFQIQSGSTCTWTAVSNASWLTVSPASGSGSAYIGYSVSANATGASRVGTITAGRQTFTVTQAAAGSVSTGLANGDFEQGRTVWVEAGSQLLYNDPARARGSYWMAWLGGYDSGTDVLSQTFTVPANASSVSLGFYYNITTSEGATTTPYDNMVVEVYSTGGARLATLGTLSNANQTAGWTASPSYSLTAFRGQTIRLVFTATTDSSNPTSFYIDDVALTEVGSTCSYSVTPATQSVSSSISTASFAVTTTPSTGCNWTAATGTTWLAVSGAASGTGSGEVRISASENTGTARSGTATIAGQTVTINQSAPVLDTSIIKNGEFESGSEYWQEGSTAGYGIITADSYVTARTGVGYAWMSGYNSGTDTLTQTVNIPSNIVSGLLSFYYQIKSDETANIAYDTLTVEIVDASTGQVLQTIANLSNINKTSVWTKSADVDISARRGQSVKLVFRSTTDGSNVSSFFIDSVKVTLVGTDAPGTASKLLKQGGVDIDGDGRGEVVVRSPAGSMMAGRLSGTQIVFTPMADPGPNYNVLAAVDLDSQGRSDLVMLNMAQGDSGEARLWTAFNPALPKTLRSVRTLWRVDAVGDLDGDGKGDLVWRFTGDGAQANDKGVSYIWFTNGSGVTQVRKRGGAPLDWTLVGARDVNGDGAADMFYISPDRQVRLLMATPNRTCANLSGGTLEPQYAGIALGSFSGLGKSELMTRNNNGQVQFIAYEGTGLSLPAYAGAPDDPNASCTSSNLTVPSTLTRVANISDPNWQLIATVDLNGDGLTDMVWRRPNDGVLVVWIMANGGQVGAVYNNAGVLDSAYQPLPR
jgi:hypothetical protein